MNVQEIVQRRLDNNLMGITDVSVASQIFRFTMIDLICEDFPMWEIANLEYKLILTGTIHTLEIKGKFSI